MVCPPELGGKEGVKGEEKVGEELRGLVEKVGSILTTATKVGQAKDLEKSN